MISAAGTSSFALALTVIEALAKGLLLAGLIASVSHWMFPEPPGVAARATGTGRDADRLQPGSRCAPRWW